jgi:hypothetical protein
MAELATASGGKVTLIILFNIPGRHLSIAGVNGGKEIVSYDGLPVATLELKPILDVSYAIDYKASSLGPYFRRRR